MKTEHTPTPWKEGKNGRIETSKGRKLIAYGGKANDNALIVKAVNSHYELLEALKLAKKTIDALCEDYAPFNVEDQIKVIEKAIQNAQ